MDHTYVLRYENDEILEFIHEGLAANLDDSLGAEELTAFVLRCGEADLKAMELLDRANTETYGHPVPTELLLGHRKCKAILVSGHDLRDIERVLKQTQGKGINVYTHGEILPTHRYPD
jgi:hydroxylamine reductase